MPTSSLPRADLALVLLALILAATAAGCGEASEDADATPPTAGGATTEVPLDGEGMEPRISIRHPIDAPGRPADGEGAGVEIETAGAAAWVPELAVADLEASVEFYRQLGFTVGGRQRDEPTARRVELARDGARLVLVAAEPDPADDAPAADAAPTEGLPEPPATLRERPMVVLHLVEPDATDDPRTLRDPDGHRLALPGGR